MESNKVKSVLQSLQKFRNRLSTDEINNQNSVNSANSISSANLYLRGNSGQISKQTSKQTSKNISNKIYIDLHGDLIDDNLFCNKKHLPENRSPEELLLEFSAGEVPTFEIACKSRIMSADKLSNKKFSDNNLTNNNVKNQTNNSVSNNSMTDNSISDSDKLNEQNAVSNIVTIIPEIRVMEIKNQTTANYDDQNKDQNNSDQERKKKVEEDIARDVDEYLDKYYGGNIFANCIIDNKPQLSVFNGEDSSDKVVDVADSGEVEELETNGLTKSKLLVTRGLEKSYFKSKLKIPVLNGVDFTAYSGEFVSITGQSGSGKSTLLHLLGALDKPDAGEIIFEDKRIDNLSVSFRDGLRNRSIGFIFQFYNLLPEFTALENVLSPLMIRDGVFGYFKRRRVYIERARELLDRVGLLHRLKHRPSELSGGEIQRVAIARSLIIEPKLLLADEPTGNLDSSSAKEVIRILRSLNEETNLTIVMVTHDNSIAATADRVVIMSDGIIMPF
jgi:lipoprotein-releasing system ATP-binding protein